MTDIIGRVSRYKAVGAPLDGGSFVIRLPRASRVLGVRSLGPSLEVYVHELDDDPAHWEASVVFYITREGVPLTMPHTARYLGPWFHGEETHHILINDLLPGRR